MAASTPRLVSGSTQRWRACFSVWTVRTSCTQGTPVVRLISMSARVTAPPICSAWEVSPCQMTPRHRMALTRPRLRRAKAEAAIGISKAPGTLTTSTSDAPAASSTLRAAIIMGSVYSEL